jgi:hypothetical protein
MFCDSVMQKFEEIVGFAIGGLALTPKNVAELR